MAKNPPRAVPAAKARSERSALKFFTQTVHCVRIAKDGLVYAWKTGMETAPRPNHQNGKFVKEGIIAPQTMGLGSAYESRLHA